MLTEGQAYDVTKILEGVITQGTGAGYTYMGCGAEAGKTGTSEDLSDAWFVGYTPLYSTAVWVGHPQSREATGFGGPTAGPIWRSFMESAVAGNCPEFPEPSSLPELSGLDSGHTSGSSGSVERIRIQRIRRRRNERRTVEGEGRKERRGAGKPKLPRKRRLKRRRPPKPPPRRRLSAAASAQAERLTLRACLDANFRWG